MLFKQILCLIASVATTAAYDIGCIYPEEAPDDPFVLRGMAATNVVEEYFKARGLETPMVVRGTHIYTLCQVFCLAYHTPGFKDPLSREPLPFTVPEFGHNAYSINMCSAQCYVYAIPDYAQEIVDYHKSENNFDLTLPPQDMKAAYDACTERDSCSGNCGAMCNKFFDEDFHPFTVGHWVGFEIMNGVKDDGWNAFGEEQYDVATGETVPCTGSCRTYQDTVGYEPQIDPRKFPEFSNDTSKYECTGRCRRWQPLQEDVNGVGSLVRQEFVVPHIGPKAKTYLRNATLSLEDPEYDLYTQSLQVIEEVKITAGDDARKVAVRFFDNKLEVRRSIQVRTRQEFQNSREISFQEYLLFLHGISSAEYDGVIQAWYEKLEHDLVRPTTVIKHWGDDILNTFGGDETVDGPVDIAARDFEAFIRVMPHGEFPSGSSCLCTTYMEFTDNFLTEAFGRTLTDLSDFGGGIYANMTEFRDACGASRLWGGMHYPEAIPAGEEICAGLGTLGVEYIREIRNNSPIPNKWFAGDARPVCNE